MDINHIEYKTLRYLTTTLVVCAFALAIGSFRDQYIKNHREYIPPNKIELDSADLNHDGKLETILRIDTTDYVLISSNNKPTLFKYHLIPIKDSLVIDNENGGK